VPTLQQTVDQFYRTFGPCCAGCDWWRCHNSAVGDCIKSAPVAGAERAGMLGIESCSAVVPAGHILTPRDHVCGEFVDTHDWNE